MALSDAILQRLLRLHPKRIDLSLERMERLLRALGDPQKSLPPVIHVAGTNGKGSVIATLRAIMEHARRRTHVYISPHLREFRERITLGGDGGGRLIEETALSALLEECESANEGKPITFFEITTAAAFLAFSRTPGDILLLEVGLGGRLDATNVVDRPAACAVTSIDIDHQQFLGATLEEIAAEKAGIFKPGVSAVIAPQRDGVLERLAIEARDTGAPLFVAGQDWQAFEQHGRLIYQDEQGLLDLPLPRLAGRHQIENAGVALAVLRTLDEPGIGESDMAGGLQRVRWAGRLERLQDGALKALVYDDTEIWIDGGHNASAGRALAASMADLEERAPRPLCLIVAMMSGKAPAKFLRPFAGLAQRVVTLGIPGEENALSARELCAVARELGFEAEPADTIREALGRCKTMSDGSRPRILICGSLYLAGHVLGANGEDTP